VARLPDYNLEKPAKRAGVIRLVKDLQARGLRIDAIDNQAHWQLQSPTIAEIDQAFTELMRVIPPPKSSAAVGAKTGRATRSRSTTSGESLRIGDVMVGAATAERFNPSSPIVEPRRREHVEQAVVALVTRVLEHTGIIGPRFHVEGGGPRRGPRRRIDERDVIVDGIASGSRGPLDQPEAW
jgi:hypothetical protein